VLILIEVMLKQKILNSTKLIEHEHTGRLKAHRHTSYGSLLLILLLVSVPIIVIGRASAATSGSGGYGVYAVVPAVVPRTPAVIQSPATGTTFTTLDPVTISGTCPVNTLVKIYKNEVMGGATYCIGNRFTVQIDLFEGNNSIIASSYNANNIPGPDSLPLSLNLIPAGSAAASIPINATAPPGGQFYVTSDITYIGINPGDSATWPLAIDGGQGPYAVSVSWGDGQNDLISRQSSGQFSLTHVYSKADSLSGTYDIYIKATDINGDQSFVDMEAIVGGKTANSETIKNTSETSVDLGINAGTELLTIAAAIILSFWFGEKRKSYIMKRDSLNQNEQ